MARQSERISFGTFNDMAAHLDRWAARSLVDPAGWEDALLGSQSWLDYSARNQVLLASYGVDGPVAGPETWRLVPSTHEGRGCAVRAGEHGYPVRVPVTTGGTEPDPYVGGTRPTRAAVERWEWRPVFAIDQLARRPQPGALEPVSLPASLSGPDAHGEFLAAARKVASSTVRGRLPKADDPERVLIDAALRLPRSARRPGLDPSLASQVGWLVADRVGMAEADRPVGFDPSPLAPRERWERLLDVLDPARKLTAALGVAVGVDLVASPLPRMEIADDRVVPAGRRHRLPAASFEQLPVGRWVSVGPYTAAEWAARGEDATGRGAYLRLNRSAYLVAVERGDAAGWRLEDVAARTGHGLLATGTATSLEQAQEDAVATTRSRYPALAGGPADVATRSPGGVSRQWEPMPGEGRSSAELRHLSDRVTIYAIPGPGGRWMPAVHDAATGSMDRLPLVRSLDDARTAAELAGQRAVRLAAGADPATLDANVADLADSGDYSRRELADLVGTRLDPMHRDRLPGAGPGELSELLGAAGVSPATVVAVLHAEEVAAEAMTRLLPTIGVPMADAIRVLRDRWDLPAADAASSLGATAIEMRDAGCTPTEIMATRPREVLRELPTDPHLWELAAGTMATAGHPPQVIAAHLVAHAPDLDTFAAGLGAAIDEPAAGLGFAGRCGATGQQLAAASERYGLSPVDTAAVLVAGGVEAPAVLDALSARCEHDTDRATALATQAGVSATEISGWLQPAPPSTVRSLGAALDGNDAAALLAVLPPPSPTTTAEPTDALRLSDPPLEPTSR